MRLISFLILLLVAACTEDPAPTPVSACRTEQLAGLRTKVVVAATESSIKAFDKVGGGGESIFTPVGIRHAYT